MEQCPRKILLFIYPAGMQNRITGSTSSVHPFALKLDKKWMSMKYNSTHQGTKSLLYQFNECHQLNYEINEKNKCAISKVELDMKMP